MPGLKRNVEHAFEIATPRDNKPYGYDGVWRSNDVWRTTDCSGIVTHILDALLHGNRMAWSRHGLSTDALLQHLRVGNGRPCVELVRERVHSIVPVTGCSVRL